MRHSRSFACLFLSALALVLYTAGAWGQILMPYRPDEGLPTASTLARDSISGNAVLLFLGSTAAPGSSPELANTIDIVNGTANVWVYWYIDRVIETGGAIPMTQWVGFGFQGGLSRIDTFRIQPETRSIDFSGAYATSDKVYGRLRENTVFRRFEENYPVMETASMAMTTIPDPKELAPDVEYNQPVWVVEFKTGGDSSLRCFVGTRTGEVLCRPQAERVLGVQDNNNAARGTAALTVTPNPAVGRARVSIELPLGTGFGNDMSLHLYNELGEEVLDLTESFRLNDHRYAEFETKGLPAGVYYCRASGTNWQGTIGVLVEH